MTNKQIIKQLEALIDDREAFCISDPEHDEIYIKDINALKAAIEFLNNPETVKHAKWKLYAKTRDSEGCIVNHFVCSNCNNMIPDVPEGLAPDVVSPHCAKCGARMDGGGNG
jgi:hypothetical protein